MAVEVPLTRGYVALIDEADAGLIRQYKWRAHAQKDGRLYAVNTRRCGGRKKMTLRMHRLIMQAVDGDFIDHIDGDGLNNQRSNLRFCTIMENNRNRRVGKNASGFKGVAPKSGTPGRFGAQIRYHKRLQYLGTFRSAEEAARAYDAAAIRLFGEFARLNFPEQTT